MDPNDFSLAPEIDPAIQAATADLSEVVTDLSFDLNAGATPDDEPFFTDEELADFPQL